MQVKLSCYLSVLKIVYIIFSRVLQRTFLIKGPWEQTLERGLFGPVTFCFSPSHRCLEYWTAHSYRSDHSSRQWRSLICCLESTKDIFRTILKKESIQRFSVVVSFSELNWSHICCRLVVMDMLHERTGQVFILCGHICLLSNQSINVLFLSEFTATICWVVYVMLLSM